MPQQLTFDLSSRPALGREDFFVAPSNEMAVAMLDTWAEWPDHRLLLIGEAGAGKSHLAAVWADAAAARVIAAREVQVDAVPDLVRSPLVIEDLHLASGLSEQEQALFHLLNLARADGQSLLLTTQVPPSQAGVHLRDLRSRLEATTAVQLGPPDDTLLSVLLVKLFADRQVTPAPELIPYLTARMDRSFAGAVRVVEALDRAMLERKSKLTKPLVREVLDSLKGGG